MVPRRQVRHLGPLGSAIRARVRRLVCPQHVHPGAPAVQVPRREIRPSVEVRLQGHHPYVEGREVRPRAPDGLVQEGRGEVFRQHGRAPRQLRSVELQAQSMERREHGPEEGHRRAVSQGRAATQGLRFGVSEHLAVSYHWFQTSHGADKEGPFKGVPYDGADPKYASLYHETHDVPESAWDPDGVPAEMEAALLLPHQGSDRSLSSPTCSTPTGRSSSRSGVLRWSRITTTGMRTHARREDRGRLREQGQDGLRERHLRARPRARRRGSHLGRSVADRHLHRPLALRQGSGLQVAENRDRHAGGYRQPERQFAAEFSAAIERDAGRRRN